MVLLDTQQRDGGRGVLKLDPSEEQGGVRGNTHDEGTSRDKRERQQKMERDTFKEAMKQARKNAFRGQ